MRARSAPVSARVIRGRQRPRRRRVGMAVAPHRTLLSLSCDLARAFLPAAEHTENTGANPSSSASATRSPCSDRKSCRCPHAVYGSRFPCLRVSRVRDGWAHLDHDHVAAIGVGRGHRLEHGQATEPPKQRHGPEVRRECVLFEYRLGRRRGANSRTHRYSARRRYSFGPRGPPRSTGKLRVISWAQ